MRVGEVSRRTGVGVSTLRAWERRFGLLQPARSSSGQRLYTEADVRRVGEVNRRLGEGLTLAAAVRLVMSGGAPAHASGEADAALMHEIMQAVDQAIWVFESGQTRYANRRMAELMRCTVDELMGSSPLDFIASDDSDAVSQREQRLRDGHRERCELNLRRPDGTVFLAEVVATPILKSGGAYKGAVALISPVPPDAALAGAARP